MDDIKHRVFDAIDLLIEVVDPSAHPDRRTDKCDLAERKDAWDTYHKTKEIDALVKVYLDWALECTDAKDGVDKIGYWSRKNAEYIYDADVKRGN